MREAKKTREYYDSIASGYVELYGAEQRKKHLIGLECLSVKQGDVVLDAGCGDCGFSELIKDRAVVINCDFSIELLKRGKGCRVCCDLTKLPFKNQVFNKVFCFTVLQDLDGKAINHCLKELKRVCAPNAWLMLSLLKQSPKKGLILRVTKKLFEIKKKFEGGKDLFLLVKKPG